MPLAAGLDLPTAAKTASPTVPRPSSSYLKKGGYLSKRVAEAPAPAVEEPPPPSPKKAPAAASPREKPPADKEEQCVDCHDFRAMLSTALERMALVCDFCASDIPARQTYWHCTTCHQTHEFEREGGCDICAPCYLSGQHKEHGPLPTQELLDRRGALTLGPSPDAPSDAHKQNGGGAASRGAKAVVPSA